MKDKIKKKIAKKIVEKEKDTLTSMMRETCQYTFVDPKSGKEMPLNLYDLTRVDAGNLDKCLEEHSGWYMFFGALWAEAEHEAAMLEARAKRVLAEERVEIRERLLQTGKATDKEVEAQAEISKAYAKSRIKAEIARKNVNVLEQALAALRQRQRTMDELCQNRRREWHMSGVDALKEKVARDLDGEYEEF